MSKDKLDALNDLRWAPTQVAAARFVHDLPRAADFEELGEGILARLQTRRALRGTIGQAKSRLMRAAESVGQAAKAAELAAITVDGGKRGALSAAVFPKGTALLLGRDGSKRLQSMRRLVRRLWPSTLAGVDAYAAYRAEWLPRLDDALWDLELAALDYDRALDTWKAALADDPALADVQSESIERLYRLVRS